VSGQDRVVRLNNGGGDLRRRIDGETQFGFLTVINGKSFQQEGSESGSGTTSDGVEYHESLETGTVVSEFSDSVEAEINDFLTDGVVTTGEIVGGIFFTGDQLFGVEQLSVGTGSNLIDDGGFQIEEHTSGDVLTSTSFREKGVEGIISSSDGLIRGHLSIRLDSVLEAEELPASVTDLNTGLSDVN